jgi:hypothetical protein
MLKRMDVGSTTESSPARTVLVAVAGVVGVLDGGCWDGWGAVGVLNDGCLDGWGSADGSTRVGITGAGVQAAVMITKRRIERENFFNMLVSIHKTELSRLAPGGNCSTSSQPHPIHLVGCKQFGETRHLRNIQQAWCIVFLSCALPRELSIMPLLNMPWKGERKTQAMKSLPFISVHPSKRSIVLP